MAAEPLKIWLERDGALLRLRFARPRSNILDSAMIGALRAAFDAHRGNAGLLAALVDHEGPNFSYGASVEEHLPEHCGEMLSSFHGLLMGMLEWPKPILVSIRGQCLGGGLEFALAGSLMFLALDAVLGQPEIKLGVLAPAASVILPVRIGPSRAEDMLLSGRSIDASTALDWGLAQAVSDDPAGTALLYFDKHLSDKSAASLALAVRAARAPLADYARVRIAEAEALYLNELMATRDADEGLRAFIEKRQPRWQHR